MTILPEMLHIQGLPKPYIHTYTRYKYGIFSRETTIHTVIYGSGQPYPYFLLETQHQTKVEISASLYNTLLLSE
jgi:hypothetical protein